MTKAKKPQGRVPWTQKAIEILDDGKWHDRDEVLRACAPLVPTEYAEKRYKFYHTSVNRQDLTQRIAQAKRYVAGHAMRNMQNHGSVIYEENGRGYKAAWR